MKRLTWQPIDNDGANAGAPFVLATPSPRRGAGSKIVLSDSFLHERAVEQVTYPRAESADQFDRGNASTTYSAVVHYEFASYRECAQFCARLGNALAGRGNLTIAYESGGEDVLPNAVWQRVPTGAPVGLAVTLTYTFIGAQMNS